MAQAYLRWTRSSSIARGGWFLPLSSAAQYPIDQRSTALPCLFWVSTSGATYPKLPARDVSCSPADSRCLALEGRVTHVRDVSSEQVNATYMPKSGTTISDTIGPLDRRGCAPVYPQAICQVQRSHKETYLRSRWTMSWSCR